VQPAEERHLPIAAADRRIGPLILWVASVIAPAVIRPSATGAIPSLRVRGAVICASVTTAAAVIAAWRAAVISSVIAPVPSVATPSVPSVVRVCIPAAGQIHVSCDPRKEQRRDRLLHACAACRQKR
jgi:hypothetical protein